MATIASAARGDPRALTPPSSSHSDEDPWGRSRQQSQTMQDKNGSVPHESSRSHHRLSIHQHFGNPSIATSSLIIDNDARKMHSADSLFGSKWDKAVDSGLSSGLSSYGQHSDSQRVGRSDDNSSSPYNARGSNDDINQPAASSNSGQTFRPGADKWIHRDKLAKIENEELQAAGFYVPRPRASSRPRRERDRGVRRDADASEESHGRSRTSDFAIGALDGMGGESWDLRTPEEIAAAEANAYFVQNGSKGGSRIPVAKVSPAPISQDYLERESPATRKASESADADQAATSLPKSRTRSVSVSAREAAGQGATGKDSTPAPAGRARTGTDSSKKSTASKKASAAQSKNGGATTRPKTRSGSTSTGTTRPRTRSGDPLSLNKAPEGDPPWMFTGYKPDPRLPPEEQLIPTVARRLAQEKWEKEGKFGNIYDKDFRPLNDEPAFYRPESEFDPQREPGREDDQHGTEDLPRRPSQDQNEIREQAWAQPIELAPIQVHNGHREETLDQASEQTQALSSEWPLKAEVSKASTMREGSSLSSMPKLPGNPPRMSVSSPRTSMSPDVTTRPMSKQSVEGRVQRVPSLSDAEEKKAGCACCVVM